VDGPALVGQLEELRRENQELREALDLLRDEVRGVRDEARAADGRAARAEAASARALPEVSQGPPAESQAILSRQVGRANFQLLDLSLDTQVAFGWSSEEGEALETLQGGGHDPHQRGFTLQQVELGLRGAVDPFFTADAYLVYFIDTEGESRFEIEEAFATSMALPFGLEEQGFQLEAGQFFTEYGRLNPVHPHAWTWLDQPIVNTRLFGGDGVRNPGVRLGWLAPLPWFSELHLGAQNAQGETMVSFLANDEVFEERAIGGRPFASAGVEDVADLTYLARWVNGVDLSDTWSAQWGVSGLFGPNATGDSGRTWIAGSDLVVKWQPLDAERGAPSLTWETEFSHRWYEADSFTGCPEDVDPADCGDPLLPGDTLRDWGLYTQLVWGFARGWETGLRYEYASGSGSDVEYDDDSGTWVPASRNDDPFRDDRHRVSPLLAFYPSEFSRVRFQFNYDRVKHLSDQNVYTGWVGLEFLFGAHAAHGY
jgi:hypothetical protein